MRRYSPPYYSPPRRGYGGRGRSPPPPPRRGHGGYGGRKEPNNGSLLVRNVPMNCRAEDLRAPFERFGPFVDAYDAAEAQYHMNGQLFGGREITVVVAAETRKRPEEMRHRGRPSRGPPSHGGRRSSYYGRSRSRSISRSRSPRYPSASRGSRYRSRSNSPAPRRRDDYSVSPRRPVDHSRSPRDLPPERDIDRPRRRSYSPGYVDADRNPADDGYAEKPNYDAEEGRPDWRSPRRTSRSPSGSRSRSADLSPRRSR